MDLKCSLKYILFPILITVGLLLGLYELPTALYLLMLVGALDLEASYIVFVVLIVLATIGIICSIVVAYILIKEECC